jgi:hypothetical protein
MPLLPGTLHFMTAYVILGLFGLFSYSDFRMVGDEVALTAANPKLDVKFSLHPAFQCMVIGY